MLVISRVTFFSFLIKSHEGRKQNLAPPFRSTLLTFPVHNVRPARAGIIDRPVTRIKLRFFEFSGYYRCYAGYSPRFIRLRSDEWNESQSLRTTWDEERAGKKGKKEKTKDDRFWYTLTPKISRTNRLYSVAAPLWISTLNRIVSSTR